jgi:hypothetical protein
MTVGIFERMNACYGQPPEDAKFFWSGGPVEVAPRTWFVSFFSGVTGFETDEGLVLVDSGLAQLAPALDGLLRRRTIVHRVRLPVRKAAWLQPVYDEAEFIVRNVIRYFGGWWSGRPSELKPAPRSRVADEVCALAGGPRKVLARAEALALAGDLRAACHLADYALEAAPEDAELAHRVADIYERRAKGETSLMAVNLFASAAAYAREGRPFK